MRNPHAVWLKDKLYVGGGKTQLGAATDAQLYVYRSTSDQWTSIYSPVYWFALTTYRSQILLIGGRKYYFRPRAYAVATGYTDSSRNYARPDVTNCIETLSNGRCIQSTLANLNIKRHSASAVNSDNWLIVIGGLESRGKLANVELYDGLNWSVIQHISNLSYSKRCVILNEKVYVMGGYEKKMVYSTSLTSINTGIQCAWDKLPTLAESASTIVSYNNYLLAIGEGGNIFVYSHDVEVWVHIGRGFTADHDDICAAVDSAGVLIVIGRTGTHKTTLNGECTRSY